MEDEAERSLKRLQRLSRNLMTAVVIMALVDVILLIIDFAP